MRPVHPALLVALFTPSAVMRIGPAAATRRAFLGFSAAALAPGSAGAETEPEDVILRRALDNNLSFQRVIQRAKEDALISGDKASCEELGRIIEVDQEAVAFEMGKLEGLAILQTNEIGDDASAVYVGSIIKRVEKTKTKIEKQIVRLKQKEKSAGCYRAYDSKPSSAFKTSTDFKKSTDFKSDDLKSRYSY